MGVYQKFKKFTFRRELEFYLVTGVLGNLSVLGYFSKGKVPLSIALGVVTVHLAVYFFQIIRLRQKSIQFDKLLTKSYRRADLVEYLTSLDEFKNSLFSMNEPELVAENTIRYTKHTLKATQVDLLMWNDDTGAFHTKTQEIDPDLMFYVYDPFILWLSDNPSLFSVRDLQTMLAETPYTLQKAMDFMEKTKSEIVFPLVFNRGLLGILTMGKKIQNEAYSSEDFSKLHEIVDVTVLSLSNSIFYKQLISMTENLEAKVKERTRELEETQSQLVMSEKMASLGVMVAGIAHEINTPAGVINAATDNLQENMLFTYKHIADLHGYLAIPEIRRPFRRILVRLLRERPYKAMDSSQKFRVKRELKANLIQAGLTEKEASDSSQFLLDNAIPELSEELTLLYLRKAYPVVEFLRQGVGAIRNIRNIKYSIRNIVRIVKALKYYSHLDQSNQGEADIREAIENTLIILHNQIKHGITIERELNDVPKIHCNIDELNQVWTNLINNSIHALKNISNAKISIRTTQAVLAGNPYVQITIEDNGTGIPPGIIDRIWDPFFTTKDQGEGSGLGLGIVKGIIEKHKGSIRAESRPGSTKFHVFLPAPQSGIDKV